MNTDCEKFKPLRNDPPVDFLSKTKFLFRMLLDFQTATLYYDLRNFLSGKKGKLLDIGCGNSPYKHLLEKDCEYTGIDIENQSDFDYDNRNISYFNGSDIPMEDASVESFICTEVLEHIFEPNKIIAEMHRILTINGKGLISIPWSARYHYIPYDFHRYTPAALALLFKDFKEVKIQPRGTDITVICSKIIVSFMGTFRSCVGTRIMFLPIIALLAIPVIPLCVLVGQLSIFFNIGSTNDPLGYTIYVSK